MIILSTRIESTKYIQSRSTNFYMKTLFKIRQGALLSMTAVLLYSASAEFVIEAEDFNYDRGRFIDDPAVGVFADKGLVAGAAGIDFKENSPTERPPGEYRVSRVGSSGLPQTAISGDAERVGGVAEFDLSAVELGEWVNYTRTFPAGIYRVTAQVQAVDLADQFIARLEKVTSDPKAPNQFTAACGAFLGRNASNFYGPLELTDVSGTPVTVALDGEETLRLSNQIGSFNINFLTFTPVNTANPMPRVDIATPANGSGIMPGTDLDITLVPVNPDSVSAVQILANSSGGEEITVAELAAPPYTATWQGVPEGAWSVLGIVADSSGLIGLSSQVTIFADGTAPVLEQARGRTTEDVILAFSESLAPDSAGDRANYSIVDADGAILEIVSASVTADGRVILVTAAQIVGKGYTVTVNNLSDLAGNAVPNGTTAEFVGNGPLLQTDLGFVVFEAEHFDRNLDDLWIEQTDHSVPSGGVSMVIPNGVGGSEMETQLEYDIKFVKSGRHYLWYRASSDNGNDDSAWLYVDGARPVGREVGNLASMTGFNGLLDFAWVSTAQDGGGPMTFDIDTPGFHAIGIARREDGARFDKFVITTDSAFNPSDAAFGEFGPPLTPREGEEVEAGGNQVEVTLDPMDVTAVEHQSITLEGDGTGTEGAVIVFQWQRKDGETWTDIPNATGKVFTIDRVELDWNDAVVRMVVLTDGDSASSNEATITITADTTAPILISASGSEDRVSLTFSEPLDAVSASSVANYQLSDGASISGVNFLASETSVILTTSPQVVGTKYTVTVSGVLDQSVAGNVQVESSAKFYSVGGSLLPQAEDGLMVFEAESYTENSDGLWIEDSVRGLPSGGLSVVLPNGVGGNEESKLEYELTFTQTGEHILWYRASGASGTDDSAWFHLDGVRPESRLEGNQASMTGFSETPDFVWRSNPQEGGGQMTFNIPLPGVYKIGLARREDGSYFDKFVVTKDPSFHPDEFGQFGPAETRAGAPELPSLEIASPGAVREGGDLVITPNIAQTARTIAKVEYFSDGEKIGESVSSPYILTLANVPSGFYTITAILVDDVGDKVSSGPINVTVEGDGGEDGDTPVVDGAGKSVIWITQVDSPAGEEFKQLLEQSAFEVTELRYQDPTPEEQAILKEADVVVLTRKTSSGNYNNQTWDETVTAPLILMTPYLSRANRWAWLGGDGLVDDTPATIIAEVVNHPIFQNIVLTDGVSEGWHTEVDRGTTMSTEAILDGGTVLASGNGNMVVAEWPAGTVAVGARMLFSAGSREPANPGAIEEAGRFNLTLTGGQAFLNAVNYMASVEDAPPAGDVAISVLRSANSVTVSLSGAAAFDVEYSRSLIAESWSVIATDVTTFKETDTARLEAPEGFYRGVAK